MNHEQHEAEVVRYEVQGPLALVTMHRPEYHNAQNSRMTYALDDAFKRACDDDNVKVIVLRGAGKHFSAGHDIGTPGRDVNQSFERASLWYDHVNKPGGEFLYAREQEVYLGMCRRWRDMPKPTIAMVQGACIAGGLMLAWVCDLIVASDDAFFQDPVVRMGIPGVEYFAHAYELPPRIAKEFLLLGERMSAQRAEQFGMVNRLYIYTPEERANGVACFTADDFRWKKAHIKSTSLVGAVLARQISADQGGNETIMFRDGFLSEAAASNVWVVKDGVVLGPPKDNLVLEGIRYGLLEELCRAAGIPFELRRVSREEVLAADEILLSSATKEVIACTRLDGQPVGNGRPGPIYGKLFAGYQQAKRSSH